MTESGHLYRLVCFASINLDCVDRKPPEAIDSPSVQGGTGMRIDTLCVQYTAG